MFWQELGFDLTHMAPRALRTQPPHRSLLTLTYPGQGGYRIRSLITFRPATETMFFNHGRRPKWML
jgi:hypothetical protein